MSALRNVSAANITVSIFLAAAQPSSHIQLYFLQSSVVKQTILKSNQ